MAIAITHSQQLWMLALDLHKNGTIQHSCELQKSLLLSELWTAEVAQIAACSKGPTEINGQQQGLRGCLPFVCKTVT